VVDILDIGIGVILPITKRMLKKISKKPLLYYFYLKLGISKYF